MSYKNHYKTLGLNETASKEEIKKSYRKLSLRYHPDRPNGNTEMFQKITEAYEILSDESKKINYDSLNRRKTNRNNTNKFRDMAFFNEMFGVPSNMGASFSPIFREINNLNIDKKYTITFQESWSGVVKQIVVDRFSVVNNMKTVESEQLYIRIPPGIDSGHTIVLKKKGNKIQNRMFGDVKIHINVVNNTNFIRDQLDLILKKEITFKESLVGFKFEIKHISGKKYSINNFDGKIINDGYMKIVPNLGFYTEVNGRKIQGNLMIVFSVKYPDKLSKEVRDKLENVLPD